MIKISGTNRFKRSFKKLSPDIKNSFDKQLEKFLSHPKFPFHESLRIKGIQGRRGIFEMTVTMGIRATWQYTKQGVLFRNIGDHDEILKNP